MLLDAKVTLAAVVVDEPNVKNTRRSLFGRAVRRSPGRQPAHL